MEWSDWYSLDKDTVKNIVPTRPGVYRIRQKDGVFGRLVGTSDIVYIGRAKGLRGRISQLLTPGAAHIAEPRVRRFTRELNRRLEFSFAETPSYIHIEKQLLKEYEMKHFELPPFNHSGG